jgi:hypothetical protein
MSPEVRIRFERPPEAVGPDVDEIK